ncbi:nidogen-1 [Chanos chanos]|uniref:Nidogen-1 n=1 Tax=Chanos chanos TaxID=29144 RepID=A0A6J2V8C0_CHACN|nr:nidogen-1 [Chanos chanos]
MIWRGRALTVLVTLLGLLVSVQCISRQEMFPFGPSAGDQLLRPGNDQTQEVSLGSPVVFYNRKFDKIYINTNGFVATEEPTTESEYLGNMPASFGMIVALQGDLDTSDGIGKVYFRYDTSLSTLQQAADHINRAFPEDEPINPTHVLVVTWLDMAAHNPHSRQDGLNRRRNTFQLVIASVESASYAILLYPRHGLQFYSTVTGGTSYTMQAGFSKGQETYLVFSKRQGPYSRITDEEETSVRALAEQTNSGKQGVWVFEIGTYPYFTQVAPGEVTDLSPDTPQQHAWERTDEAKVPIHTGNRHQVEEYPTYRATPDNTQDVLYRKEQLSQPGSVPLYPVQFQPQPPRYQPGDRQVVVVEDGEIDVDVFTYNSETCANNRQKCSNFADCRDYPNGYCCHCRPGFYGNGKQCVAEGKPQRMNGKVIGRVTVGNSPYPVEFSSNDLHAYVVANDGRAYVAISGIPESVGFSLQPLSSLGGVIGWAFALQQPGYKNGFSIIGGEFTRQAEVTFMPRGEKLTITQEFKGLNEHDHLVVDTKLEGTVPEVPRGATVQIDPYSEVYQYSNNLITSSSTRDYVISLEDGTTENRSFQWRQTITFQSCIHDETIREVPATQMLSVDQVFVMYSVNDQLMRYAMSNKIGDISGGEQPEENPCFTGRHGCDTNAACRPGHGNQFTCECISGFTGDGRGCYDVDECRESPYLCGQHATCSNQPGTFHCECMDGFQFAGDGQTCVEVNRPTDHCQAGTHDCDIPERARCSYSGGSAYICSCLPGYLGDGRICQDIDECQQGRCHQNAICYNTQGSFTCQCRPGFYGDGFYCSSEREKTRCEIHRETALGSSPDAYPRGPRPIPGAYVPTCDAQGNYEPTQCHVSIGQCWCVDRNGLEIDGTRTLPGSRPMCFDGGDVSPIGPTPRPDVQPVPPGTHLLFAQSGKIEYIPMEGSGMKISEAKTALHLPEKVVIGVAYDCVERMVYWTDITTPAIGKADLQGGEPVQLIRSDLGSPEGIAIDHLGRTMYWTDSMKDRIEVASLDGAQRRVLIDTDLVNPRAIITDPNNGYLYWADWNRNAPKIEVAHMDGTSRRVLAKDDLGLPNGLTYDPQTSLLCWADAGTHKVECMNPNQNNRRQVMEGIQYPFGMASHGKNLFYTDWRRNAVIVIDSYAGRETEEFQPQKRSRLYGIATAYAQCPSGQNYCSVNNGGCTHLCLPTPTGRTCRCPDNAVGVSCVERDGRL